MESINHSAYQGKNWQARTQDFRDETNGNIWANHRVSSEYARLKAVLLYCPKEEILHADPNSIQHLEPINPVAIAKNFQDLARIYQEHKVEVHWVAAQSTPPPNLFYQRDLFFMCSEGAVIARTASLVRAGEEKYTAAKLAQMNVPILRTISGRGLFEGADALWLNPSTLLCGIGNRSNELGIRQLEEILPEVNILRFSMPSGVQHLLGILQIVDSDLALVRTQKAPGLVDLLARHGIQSIAVEESLEVQRQGMNIVCLDKRKVLMPANCPNLKDLYVKNGIETLELEIDELRKGAGGIACATGILARELC